MNFHVLAIRRGGEDRPGGAASIYQMALGVRVDGDVGPITLGAGEQARAAALLPQMRAARERYEREVVGRDERSRFWRGLVNRWNNALVFAEEFLDLGGNMVEPVETREIPGDRRDVLLRQFHQYSIPLLKPVESSGHCLVAGETIMQMGKEAICATK